jgi:hypothetical protein
MPVAISHSDHATYVAGVTRSAARVPLAQNISTGPLTIPEHAEPAGHGRRLDQRDAEVAVEGLEDHVDGLGVGASALASSRGS